MGASARVSGAPRGGRRPHRSRVGTPATVALLCCLIGSQILLADPAAAHGGGEAVLALSVPARVARTVAIAAAVLVAGAAVLRPVADPPTEAARRLIVPAASAAVLAVAIGVLAGLPALDHLGLGALVALAAAAAVAAPRVVAMLSGLGVIGWLCRDAIADGFGSGVLMAGHVGVAAVWGGVVLAGATAAPQRRASLVRRLSPYAIAAAGVTALTGVLSAREYNLTLAGLTITDFGALVAAKAVLLGLVAALGLTAHLALRARRVAAGLARGELAVLALALIAGAVLTGLPAPGPVSVTGVPMARRMVLGDAITGVVLVPQRPGTNLVHLSTDRFTELVVDGRRYQPSPRPGADGLWAHIDLPEGHSRLEVRQGRQVVQQVLDAGSTPAVVSPAGPDGAECVAAALGALLGGSQLPLTACPHQGLDPADAEALRATLALLDRRGVRSVALIADDTPRGSAAAVAVRSAATRAGMTIRSATADADALLATAGWEASETALRSRGNSAPPYGTYLAPWLAQTRIVAAAGGAPLAALPFDPHGTAATAYISALRTLDPGLSANASGFRSFLAARGRLDGAAELVLYAATRGFTIMAHPGSAEDFVHHDAGAGWLPGAPLTPVGDPRTLLR